MKEWIYKKGEEYNIEMTKVPLYMRILLFWVYDFPMYEKTNVKPFIDLINEKGKIRRVYVEEDLK